MHELTLCYQTYEIIEQQAKASGANKITAIWLEIGAFSCIEIDAMTFCFELVFKGTLAENCKVHIHKQKPLVWCDQCHKQVNVSNIFVPSCALCDNINVVIEEIDDKVWVKKIQID